MKYTRGVINFLPHDEIEPVKVAQATLIARALCVYDDVFVRAVGYSMRTVDEVCRSTPTTSSRIRTDFLICSREIISEHRQVLFDLASVEPTELPDSVFPYRLLPPPILVPDGWERNVANPYQDDKNILLQHLWSTFYLSCRPSNSIFIHFYGQPLVAARFYIEKWPEASKRPHLQSLLSGPSGYLNKHSQMANPTLLDYFSKQLDLHWNIWGQTLWQGEGDINADARPVT